MTLSLSRFEVRTPADGSVLLTREHASPAEIEAALAGAAAALPAWRRRSVEERCAAVTRFVDRVLADRDAAAEEISRQMGRPISQAPGELRGFEERARHMLAIGPSALADVVADPGLRYLKRRPLGVVFVVAAWNYPYLIAVNSIVPALVAGNTVVLKHSSQTPLVAERLSSAAQAEGVPLGHLHLSHEDTERVVRDPRVDFVAFTGSVEGGRRLATRLAGRFIGIGLELGGKDPAYVRHDADVARAAEGIADGAFFNAGQSCCGIERVYVHESHFDAVVDGLVAEARKLRLGDPLDPSTNLGPMVRVSAADAVRRQVDAAVAAGARTLVNAASPGGAYVAPEVLVDVTHEMDLMTEETFGPVVGVMPVASDEEAVARMNDSRYGLTASIWTRDLEAAARIGEELETGTVFANRCDYLDPALAWVGVKDSGRGCTLSRVGYEHLTRPMSFHLRA